MEIGNYYKKRDDSLRERFNDIAEDYEKYRFTYPDKLFEDIMHFSISGEKALEIGIGTGKATPMFLQEGYEIVAVEPVKNMLDIAKRKFLGKSIKFINSTFENFEFVDKYDLIYAASSFQWINGCDRLGKVYSLLRKGGVFARFKTVNIIDETKNTNNALLKRAYQKYLPDYLPTDAHKKHMSNDEYEKTGFFDFKQNEYFIDHEFDVEMYIKLINTYTEYIALDVTLRNEFESYIRSELTGRKVIITQKCTLFLARK